MIDRIPLAICTGCSACASICPTHAIHMEKDDKGFLAPRLAPEACRQCGACLSVCPVNQEQAPADGPEPAVYAAWSRDVDTRLHSTSGGIFSELAKDIFAHHGAVAGAVYDEHHLVHHILTDNPADLERLRQSKYVQSDKGQVFQDIRRKLRDKRPLLFVGSPCEVAGLRRFLGRDYDHLLLCDFVCRGTNSPRAYEAFLRMLEQKHGSPVRQVWFKNKTHGWNRFSTKITFADGQSYLEDRDHDFFMLGYIHYNLFMRDCCAHCRFKQLPREGDITLADFWGVGSHQSDLDDDQGTSLVMVNTPKGRRFFTDIQPQIQATPCPWEWAVSGNACILQSAPKDKYSDEFFHELGTMPFDQLIEKIVRKHQHRTWREVLGAVERRIRKIFPRP